MLPTMVLAGLGFALAYGPLNIAATNGIAPEEQGLAGGLLNTSFQFGGALVLAIVTAVNNAYTGTDGSPEALLDGFRAGDHRVARRRGRRRGGRRGRLPAQLGAGRRAEPRPSRRLTSSRRRRRRSAGTPDESGGFLG